jgi:fumarylacetoacetase
MTLLNETHDPALTSWVTSANIPGTDFPIQNLPFAIFRRQGSDDAFRGGVAIGDQVVDLAALAGRALFDGKAAAAAQAASGATLNALMGMGAPYWSALRLALSRALRAGSTQQEAVTACLVPMREIEHRLPAQIGDYTDFYTSIHHATNIGKLFRPDNPLLPNYQWIPIGYHGRASSIVLSGQAFHRPQGQLMPPGVERPTLGPSKRLDIELELGIFIGSGNALGAPVPITEAEQQVFGLCLLNDWSARDIQGWEYQPLGPFLGKNFGTTISPWIITPEALAPFRMAQPARPAGDPKPMDYLWDEADQAHGALALELEVLLMTPGLRAKGLPPHRLSLGQASAMYWTPAQLVAHHACGGCNLQPGDLLGTGTLSTEGAEGWGSLLEITRGGKQPVELASGETRRFLEDGDELTLAAHARKPGYATIGFGPCSGVVQPAV